jgi:hypothetical protein
VESVPVVTRLAAKPLARVEISSGASMTGSLNVPLQMSSCHRETTTIPSAGWIETLIRLDGDRGSTNQTRSGPSDRFWSIPTPQSLALDGFLSQGSLGSSLSLDELYSASLATKDL